MAIGLIKKAGSAAFGFVKNNPRKTAAIAGTIGAAVGYDMIDDTDWYKQFDRQYSAFSENEPTHFYYPENLGEDGGYDGQNIVHFTIMERVGFRNIHNIYLPQPSGFQLGDSHSYTGIEKTGLRQVGEGVLNRGGELIQAFQDPGKLKQLGTSASIDSMVADVLVANTLVTGFIPFIGDEAQELAFAAGAAADNGTRQRFDSSAIRKFSFDFEFQAKNYDEAIAIANIIMLFRTMSYPRKGSNQLSVNYPPEVLVNFKKIENNGDLAINEYYPALLPAFIEGVTTDYNPNTLAHHWDGSPQTIKMQLTFTEVKRLIRDELEALEIMTKRNKQEERNLFYSVNNEALNNISNAVQNVGGGE